MSGVAEDLTGQQFGRLTVVAPAGKDRFNKNLWQCKCVCGGIALPSTHALICGNTQSCGCYRREQASKACRIDITGERFGFLVAVKPIRNDGQSYRWACTCDCGNSTETTISSLRSGNTKSCGCLGSGVGNFRHGFAVDYHSNLRPEYRAYENAKQRCTNPNNPRYADYGGRGIEFLFDSFEEFYAELGDKPGPETSHQYSVDRIDNDGNYERGNVRWATASAQTANSRRGATTKDQRALRQEGA